MCDPGDVHKVSLIIRVVKIPAGPAPEWVRKEWLRLEMKAWKMPPDGKEHNFLKGELLPNRGGFLVDFSHAIEVLADKSPEAANWFIKHRNMMAGNSLAFGPDEVEVLSPGNCRHIE